MTPALTAGPLSADMVPLLTEGRSVLLAEREGIVTFSAIGDGDDLICTIDSWTSWTDRRSTFTYIGERSDDGWITGLWSENPVGRASVEYRVSDDMDDARLGFADQLDWRNPPAKPKAAIIAFRLVETL